MDANERLKNYFMEGIVADLYTAEQSYALLKQIGQNSEAINKVNFGALFGPMQAILTSSVFLSVAKLFGKLNKKYPTRSIPSVMQLLKQSSVELSILQKPAMVRRLAAAGMNVEALAELADPEFTLAAVQFYTDSSPSTDLAKPSRLSKALNAVVTQRDKVVAHNEMIDRSALPQTTWEGIEHLILFAKGFVDAVGIGYTGMAFAGDDGHHFLTSDAQRAARVLRKLLIEAKVLIEVRQR